MKNRILKAYKTGIGWGITMFIIMVFVWPLINREEITPKSILTGVLVWIIFGSFLFGYLMNLKLFNDSK
ncbi:MAG: hypothetical protein ACON4X_02970 [Polaribacter sp.]|jgi:uncharacterized membrane protein